MNDSMWPVPLAPPPYKPEKRTFSKPATYLITSPKVPGMKFSLKLYHDASSKHKHRARLTLLGQGKPYVEYYCNQVQQAKAWAKETGAEKVFKKMDDATARKADLTLGAVYQILKQDAEFAQMQAFMEGHPALLEKLGEEAMQSICEEACVHALRELYPDNETVRIRAAAILNDFFFQCQLRDILHHEVYIRISEKKGDSHTLARHQALNLYVMPEALCKAVYDDCCEKAAGNGYYVALLLMLTMGMSIGEICGLQLKDLCGSSETDEGIAQDSWQLPGDSIWCLKIRRFYKKIHTAGGAQEQRLTVVESPYKFRVLPVPPQMQQPLARYVAQFVGCPVNQSLFCLENSQDEMLTPFAFSHFVQKYLKSELFEEQTKEIPVPAADQLHDMGREKLTYTVRNFESTFEYHLRDICGFEPQQIQYYMGKAPYTTIDRHYWEAKTELSMERLYGLLRRWDLRSESSAMEQLACSDQKVELCPPIGQCGKMIVQIEGNEGTAVSVQVAARYGLDISYRVLHKEEKKEDTYAETDQ